MKRLMPRALVVLTVLVVLGVGGYAGQVWWARQVALQEWRRNSFSELWTPISYLKYWRKTPWYGGIGDHPTKWVPKRFHYELCRLWTPQAQDLPNDPDAWEAWFKAHPNLVWDAKQKRLVEPKP